MMISPHKTPALAKLAMLLLFAIATVAILNTTSISAQEQGKTITSPFGVANPYMNASDASESGSEGDTFVDPETGEVGHIIRNPFGQAADPEMDNTDSDTFEEADEGDEFYISLPDENAVERNDSKREEKKESADSTPANSPKGGSSSNQNLYIIPTDEDIKPFHVASYTETLYIPKRVSPYQSGEIEFMLMRKKGDGSFVEYNLSPEDDITWSVTPNVYCVKTKKTNACHFSFPSQEALGKSYIVQAAISSNPTPVKARIAFPKVELKSISFHHGQPGYNQSLEFWKNFNEPCSVPEYVMGENYQYAVNDPVLYKADNQKPVIIVCLSFKPAILLSGISGVKMHGERQPPIPPDETAYNYKQVNYTRNINAGEVYCYLKQSDVISGGVRKTQFKIKWHVFEINGTPVDIPLGQATEHTVYVIPNQPAGPWKKGSSIYGQQDMLDFLLNQNDLSNGIPVQISGKSNDAELLEDISHILRYSKGVFIEDTVQSQYIDSNNNSFELTHFATDIDISGANSSQTNPPPASPPVQPNISSADSAIALHLFAALLGIDKTTPQQQDPFRNNKKHSFCVYKETPTLKLFYDAALDQNPPALRQTQEQYTNGISPFNPSDIPVNSVK